LEKEARSHDKITTVSLKKEKKRTAQHSTKKTIKKREHGHILADIVGALVGDIEDFRERVAAHKKNEKSQENFDQTPKEVLLYHFEQET